MTVIDEKLPGWANAHLARLDRPMRWREKRNGRHVRRQATYAIVSQSTGGVYIFPANRKAQVIGEPVAA